METPAVVEELVETCMAGLATDSPAGAIQDAVRELFADPQALAAQIPPFADDEVEVSAQGHRLGGEHVAHRSADLTVMVLDTLPGVTQPPHDHNMHAFIGVFEGAEEQRCWSRTEGGIAPSAGRMLEPGDVIHYGTRAIHAISAPTDRAARAIHVYLGDIYDIDRSVFDPETLDEHPMTSDRYDEFCRKVDL